MSVSLDSASPDDTRRVVPRSARVKALVLVAALLVLALVGYLINAGSAGRLTAAMTGAAQGLLPGGQVHGVEVSATPALLAERRGRVPQTVVRASSKDGHPVTLFVREYDLNAHHAESVSWQIGGVPLAPGWKPVTTTGGAALDQAEKQVGGHVVALTAGASVRGDQVQITADQLTVDGVPTAPSQAPADVRAAVNPVLAPQTLAVPLPRAGAKVRSVWIDETGIAVELRATDVAVANR